jgi:trimeric autotransporter adhesin
MPNIPSRRPSVWITLLLFLVGRASPVGANPTGLSVVSGNAAAQQLGAQLNITVSQTAILNWQSFNIAAGESTSFLQPSASSIVFNVIGDRNPSQIFGSLNANGTVILANANGFYFGPNSMIKVGGSFIATTAPVSPDFGSGATWQFAGMPPLASIINYGRIEVGQGRSLFLIAEKIENHGDLIAPGGSLDLIAGQSVLVSESPDGRGLAAQVQLPQGSVDNFGRIVADAGTILLQAKVVNQNGIIQADSIQNQHGVIELVSSDQLNLGANSHISASGDDAVGGSAGGSVTLRSENKFSDEAGSEIYVVGGANGGNGGSVEICAENPGDIRSQLDGSAQAGFAGGKVLIDPTDLTLNSSSLNPYSGFSDILFQASGSITLSPNTTWNLSANTGNSSGQLALEAGNDIIFGSGAKITDANNWSVTLKAGFDFVGGAVQSGVGNIYLNGGSGKTLNGTIQTAAGSINLQAGQSIQVGTGSIYTTGGGNIYADALAGDINCGTANGGYQFSIFGYSPASVLGGMATAAGGDVTLIAGNNITSIPTVPSGQLPGASGAYGAGNVTLIAGNQILGNYTLANGVGTILAGTTLQDGQPVIQNSSASIGTLQRPVNLSLIRGAWNAWSGGDIYVGEVRNPNGAFNSKKRPVTGNFVGNIDNTAVPTQTEFAFDYAANAAANFWAGNAIELVGANLPRINGQNQSMPPIYAPCLSLNAGAGGIKIDNSIILYPSSQGSLSIITRDGGDLIGAVQASGLTTITMSDSGLPGWATFLLGHAATPLHLNDPNPVALDISGDIRSLGLTVPTFANINVDGNTYNFGFSGRNLSTLHTTSITVGGDITYRGDLTSVSLTDPLPELLFTDSANPSITGKLYYDATTGKLTFVGVMNLTDLAFLRDPSIIMRDQNGQPVLNADGTPQTAKLALTAAQLAAINELYAASQDATLGDNGLLVAGPGQFSVTANNIDLGISGGIAVVAPDAALAAISPYGAGLTVTTLGNLTLTSTRIANESLLGGVTLNVGGVLDVGSQFTTFGDPNAPKGIFTTSGGNLNINVHDNVNVNGSRIAAYNGGNVTVESQTGDINAGTGGAGYISMNALELDPHTGKLVSIPASIPGSGILATTLFGSQAQLGNITLLAPEGSVNASLGGVLQIAFNGKDSGNSFIEIDVGKDITATGSGIIGSNIRLTAGGDINGVIIGSQGININAQKNVDVTAVSGGNVDISASGTVAGTVVGGGDVSVSGDSILASVLGVSVSASGDTSGASLGIPQSNVSKENAETAEDASVVAAKTDNADDDEEKKQRGKGISLAQKTGRVTVVLPPRQQPKSPNDRI